MFFLLHLSAIIVIFLRCYIVSGISLIKLICWRLWFQVFRINTKKYIMAIFSTFHCNPFHRAISICLKRSVCWACRIFRLNLCRAIGPLPKWSLSVCWGVWPVMLQDVIIVAEQSLTGQPKWSRNLQHSNSAVTELGRLSKRFDPINLLIMLSPSTFMIVPIVFLKLL